MNTLNKALDISLDVMTSSYREEELRRVFVSYRVESLLIRWAERFLHGLNLILMIGLLVHRTPMRYVVAMKRACGGISGIVFQYPFYAGIMGIMMATGLGKAIAVWMASFVTLKTLPLAAYLLGGFVNFSIPSAAVSMCRIQRRCSSSSSGFTR